MRVLLPIIWHELTHCIERAFKEQGHETRVVNWRKWEGNPNRVRTEIINAATEFQPDLVWCQFQSPHIATPKLVHQLKEVLGCYVVQWVGDVRFPLPQHYIDLAPHFDVTSFSNRTDVEEIRALGHRSEFLQIGYDERIYNTDNTGERDGVVFIGNNYGGYKFAESDSRRNMVHALHSAFGDRFTVYGQSWEPYKGQYVREPGDALILKRASIAVGWDHFHRPGFASDRLLRATACGCAVVNQYYEGIEDEHPHVIAVKTIEEMVESVGELLADPKRAKELGELNAANTLKKHRWNERVKIIEQWML